MIAVHVEAVGEVYALGGRGSERSCEEGDGRDDELGS
jgi:hypothetical protein